ncbi:Dimodular nonribosomal peptide synthase [Stieleria neptunia]|uniref:Dimodular nonribosomal peptide synthase n=1 Tax=Stieleria neptunia TaxID=2527979 RepID=A0A518HZ39_9BACT|nr:non-ribosomal peptide synthetase [Stieleria neptunia]QDV46112.1 Dimodular nonribosomal peptide synthase [Stieleria neptunia]
MNDALDSLSGQQKRELLARLLKQKAAAQQNAAAQRERQPHDSGEFPLSAGQQALWYAYQRAPQVTAYNVALPSRFRSAIDLDAMRRSVEALVDRHSALRTVFAESESTHQPVQRIQTTLTPEFRVVETPSASQAELAAWVTDEINRPFDLTRGPLLRLAAFRIAADDVVMVATTHHIVVDFWSLVLIMDEIRQLYPALANGRQPNLAAAPCNYERFVCAQADLVTSDRGEQIAEYWQTQLAAVPAVIEWPTDFERPASFTHRASVVPLNFPPGMGAKVTALSRRLGVTGNVVVMALLQVLVGRFAGQDSFSIGTPFSGRSQREFEKTVGFFVNLLPITVDLSSNPTLEQLIATVGQNMIDALAGESLPLAEIVRASGVGRDPRRHPLFQVSCTFEKSQIASEQGRAGFVIGNDHVFDDFAGMRQESFPVQHTSCHYDVEFVFELHGDELRGMICYCRDLFAADTIDSMANQFVALSDQLVADPRQPVKNVPWSGCQPAAPHDSDHKRETLIDLLGDSDHEIVAAAQRFATLLQRRGVEPRALVPVCMKRGRDAWVGILGVMYCGATPIPIDADQPAVSSEVLRHDAVIKTVVAAPNDPWANAFGADIVSVDQVDHQDTSTCLPCTPDDLAYVIYTSGSTGRPKGVMVSHAAISNAMRWQERATPFSPSDRALVLLSHQFDATLPLVVTTAQQNASLVWPDQIDRLDLDQLIEQILRDRITILQTVPSVLRAIAAHPRFAECTSVRQIWTGGEAMPSELPEWIHSKLDCELWNFYGPTEAACQVTAHRVSHVPPDRRIPIGREIDGVHVHLVDTQLAPVPVGVPGQIVISGRGLADGYLNQPELTEQSFLASQQIRDGDGKPSRVYLTGDLGRRRGDGTIEFLGRVDHQIKLRGYRIELEEIERTIERFPGVERAAVKVIRPGSRGERLAAFVAGVDASQRESLNRHLSTSLPPYKRPATIHVLDQLPLNANGKIDRKRLTEPVSDDTSVDDSLRPRNALETFLERRFAAALEQDSIGIDVNFFEAGGTSLQAAVLTSELSDELGFSIPTALLFDLGDIRSVASRLVDLHEASLRDRFGDASIRECRPAVSANETESEKDADALLVELKRSDDAAPVFMIHPPGGIVVCYRELAGRLPEDQPLVAIRSRGLHGAERLPSTLSEMASDYVRSIRRRQPSGRYFIGGWSLGGVIAFEVARQLAAGGADLAGLILLDSTVPERCDPESASAGLEYGLDLSLDELSELSADEQLPFLYQHAQRLGVLQEDTPTAVVQKAIADLQRLFAHHVELCQGYEIQPMDAPVLLLRPRDVPGKADQRPDRGWGRWTGEVTVSTVSGHHHSMVKSPGAGEIAEQIVRFVASAGIRGGMAE